MRKETRYLKCLMLNLVTTASSTASESTVQLFLGSKRWWRRGSQSNVPSQLEENAHQEWKTLLRQSQVAKEGLDKICALLGKRALLGTCNCVENREGGWRKVQGHRKKTSVVEKDLGYPTGARKLLNNLKHTKDCLIFFLHEMFTVNLVRNCDNDQYLDFGDNMEDHITYISLTKHVGVVMFLGLVCSNEEISQPILFDSGYQLNIDGYIDVMTSTIIPWMRKVGGKKFVFQQDWAPAHIASKTQVFFKKPLTFGPSKCGLPRAQTLTPWTTVCGGKWRVVHVRLSHRMSKSWRPTSPRTGPTSTRNTLSMSAAPSEAT